MFELLVGAGLMPVPIVLVSDGCLRGRDAPATAGETPALTVRCYGLAPPSDVVASMPPRPMVSTADEGTMTIAPFSLTAS